MIGIRIRKIIKQCIEQGIRIGIMRAKKHTETPHDAALQDAIDNAIWENLDDLMDIKDDDDEEEEQESWRQ